MALISKKGVCIADTSDGRILRALFADDDVSLAFDTATRITSGEWLEFIEEKDDWDGTLMTQEDVRAFMKRKAIKAFAG